MLDNPILLFDFQFFYVYSEFWSEILYFITALAFSSLCLPLTLFPLHICMQENCGIVDISDVLPAKGKRSEGQ